MIITPSDLDKLELTATKKAAKNTLTTAYIYKLHSHNIESVRAAFNTSTKQIVECLNKSYYNAGILHLAALNSDVRVLEFIVSLFEQHKLKPAIISLTSDAGTGSHSMYKGDTPMSVAVRLADINKIKFLANNNLGLIDFPVDMERYECANLLEYCMAHYRKNQNEFFMKFALMRNLESYKVDYSKQKIALYAQLLKYTPIYSDDYFCKNMAKPIVLSFIDTIYYYGYNSIVNGAGDYIEHFVEQKPELVDAEIAQKFTLLQKKFSAFISNKLVTLMDAAAQRNELNKNIVNTNKSSKIKI